MRRRVEELTEQSAADGFWDDPDKAQKLMQERSAALERVEGYEKTWREAQDLQELFELASGEQDEAMLAEVLEQLPALQERVRQLEVQRMLSGEGDQLDAIVTIHPGAGGVDAQDWAEMLLRMYLRWAERRGFKVELVEKQPGDEAGIKSASVIVRGPYAYGYLRAESGVHRLIRISPFDANARRQTAFAAVAVVPELQDDDLDIEIRPEELEVQTMRSSGAGGQHVNKTESAIRIKHLPTGIVVKCSAERSQHQNRAHAMKMLKGLLFERARREREEKFEEAFGGDKSEIQFGSQIRTYTLHPYKMVKDERTGFKKGNADAVLDGDLDEFIEAYLMQSAGEREQAEN